MKKILFFLLNLSFVASTFSQRTPTFVRDSLDNYIQQGMKDWQIPAVAVAIVKDGEVSWMKGYGTTKIEGGDKVDEHTLFMIGSNTKAFTALALAILEEEGKLSLNDEVKQWIPEFKLKNALAAQEASIADMLSHRIGFETFQGDFTYWTSNLSRKEVIQRMGQIEAPYGFRTKWGYCNAAFLTAGEIIPKASGMSWEEAIQNKITQPLGMSRTISLAAELPGAKNKAYPHTIVNEKLVSVPFPNIDNLAPAGSMSSSIKDMANWMLVNLNDGQLNGQQLISAKAINRIRQPYSIMGIDPRDAQDTHFYLYGLGLMINDKDGKLVYSHTGDVNGFLSATLFVPEENLGIVILTNTDKNNFYQSLADELLDAFLGLPYQNYSQQSLNWNNQQIQHQKTLIDSLQSVAGKNIALPLDVQAYLGSYTNEVYGIIEVKSGKNHDLEIHFSNHPHLVAYLNHLEENQFLCTYSDPIFGEGITIPFKAEGEKIKSLELGIAGYVEPAPYHFEKKK
ncbi:MAG: serine hydrolase [Chitinophagales bacterium]|nr:serine hydrolase [Chitinophagales bacterium]